MDTFYSSKIYENQSILSNFKINFLNVSGIGKAMLILDFDLSTFIINNFGSILQRQ